jgi:hypothetical protein
MSPNFISKDSSSASNFKGSAKRKHRSCEGFYDYEGPKQFRLIFSTDPSHPKPAVDSRPAQEKLDRHCAQKSATDHKKNPFVVMDCYACHRILSLVNQCAAYEGYSATNSTDCPTMIENTATDIEYGDRIHIAGIRTAFGE